MKLRSSFCALITAALFVGSTRLAVNAEHELIPLQSLAVRICGEGQPFPTSRLFDYFELDVPFLILTVGSEMIAAPVSQCRNFRTVEIESFYLVFGHRSTKETDTFYVTSLRGNLIQTVHIITSSSDIDFVDVTPTHEVRAEFEGSKAFWLSKTEKVPQASRRDELN